MATATVPPLVGAPAEAPRTVEIKGSGRHYQIPTTGALLPSVTTILDAIGKPALVPWAANQERTLVTEAAATLYAQLLGQPALEKPAYISALTNALGTTKAHTTALAKAAEIGTQVHKHIEWVLRKELRQVVATSPPPLSPKALVAYQKFAAWRETVSLVPQRIEQVVWSSTHGYAGTLDLLATITIHGVPCPAVLDWKSGKAIYPEALLQNTAYVAALAEMGHAPGPVHGVIVRLPKLESDPVPEIKIIPPGSQAALFEVFLKVKGLWEWLQEQERARQDARTRPAVSNSSQGNGDGDAATPTTGAEPSGVTPGAHRGGEAPADGQPTFEDAARAQVLADLAIAKAALARQPADDLWLRIVLAHTGVTTVQDARRGALLELLATVKGLAKKDPVAIARVKAILDRPTTTEPPAASTPPTNTAAAAAETRPEATGSFPTSPGVAGSTPDPALAAVLVDEGDPREGLLTAIADAKGQLERQPPEAMWAEIIKATCDTADLTKAGAAGLNDLLVLVKALVAGDAAAIACVSGIIARSKA